MFCHTPTTSTIFFHLHPSNLHHHHHHHHPSIPFITCSSSSSSSTSQNSPSKPPPLNTQHILKTHNSKSSYPLSHNNKNPINPTYITSNKDEMYATLPLSSDNRDALPNKLHNNNNHHPINSTDITPSSEDEMYATLPLSSDNRDTISKRLHNNNYPIYPPDSEDEMYATLPLPSDNTDTISKSLHNNHHPHPHPHHHHHHNTTISISQQEKATILELTLLPKRPPQFPGSIYTRPPHGNSISLPPLNTLFNDESDDMLLKAIEIRRKVTLEIFIDVMIKKGKFGITYSKNLGSNLGIFIDFVMIQAAEMKKVVEFDKFSFNARARKFIVESNVVPLIRWLKHNDLSYPQIGKMICLVKGDVEVIRGHVEWLKSIHVKGRYIGVVFMRVGEIILKRSIDELDEIVAYLEMKGVRRDWMGYVISRCAELLAFSMDEVRTRVSFYTDLGMNDHDFGTMVYDFPKILGYFSLEEMKQKVNYIKDFGLDDNDVGRLLAFKPQLMACGIEERWKPLLRYLYYLGIDRDGMRRMLIIKPMVFCVDLEATIVPKVRFLQEIGVKDDAIGRMLVRFPPLLTYSLYKKIRPVVVFLLTKAGVKQKNIAKVVALAPELLGCSIAHKLDGNVKYYLSLGISLRQLGDMIADFPMLLRYNVELLRPKYRYLRRTMVRPLQDLIEFPRFFSYSLDDKIIPRHKVLLENRVNFKLRYMLASTDEEFHQRVKNAVERRQRFESGVAALETCIPNETSETADSSFVSEPDPCLESKDSEMSQFDPVFTPNLL